MTNKIIVDETIETIGDLPWGATDSVGGGSHTAVIPE